MNHEAISEISDAAEPGSFPAESCSGHTTVRPDRLKSDLLARLRRIEGQIGGIRNMVERDVYCDDILHQISAVQAALKSAGQLLLRSHIQSCVVSKIEQGDREIIDELMRTISKMT
jgi:DNA-binding FrmR family transcriptional regulator